MLLSKLIRRTKKLAQLSATILHTTAKPRSAKERYVSQNIDTIVIPLGPYRNLTTFTAAIFALHPEGLVLNHADSRIRRMPWADMVAHPTKSRMRRFLDVACVMAQRGKRGDFGGNILLAHAFDDPDIQNSYKERFGKVVLKDHAHVLFWKDSMKISNRIRLAGITPQQLIEAGESANIKIKFFMPIRHPVDCARSNLRTKHYRHLTETGEFEIVLYKIIEEIVWFNQIRQSYPNNTFWFTEDEVGENFLKRLCAYIGLNYDAAWSDVIEEYFKVRGRERSDDDLCTYRRIVDKLCSEDEELHAKLYNIGANQIRTK